MALAQSSCNQRYVENIKFMVVGHDHAFLETLKHMLESSILIVSDSWGLECTVLDIGDPREALSTLKTQSNNIDFIITDYDMPDMNGIQLKRQINQEFRDIPVMIMSSDIKNQEESLSCGAIGFIQKPIDPSDIPTILHFALTSKKKGKSKSTENNPKEKDVSVIPKQINLPPGPGQTDVLKILDKKISSSTSDSRPNGACISPNEKKKGKSILSNENKHKDKDVSVVPKQINLPPGPEQTYVLKIMDKNSSYSSPTNEGCVSPNGSSKDLKRKSEGGPSDDDEFLTRPIKKTKIVWDQRLHDLFLDAIHHIGSDKAVPKTILEFMNVPNLTMKNVASHLQKYRLSLKKVNELKSSFLAAHTQEPYFNPFTSTTYGSETSPNNSSFYSTLGNGLGQSRTNIPEPVYFNQIPPNNYINRSFTHEPIGSESNSRFSEQAVNANKIGQTSQVLGFGLPGQSGISDNGFNNNMMSSYGPFTPNQPGPSNFPYGMQSFLNNENVAYNSHPHANATAHPDLNANEMLYNKGHFNEETSNTFVVPETNPPFFNMNPNQHQEQDNVPDLSSLDPEELLGVDFTNSLFKDMKWEEFS